MESLCIIASFYLSRNVQQQLQEIVMRERTIL